MKQSEMKAAKDYNTKLFMTNIDTLIKSPSSAYIELSIFHALIRLNSKPHMTGEPDVVVYKDEGGKLNSIFTIGTKNGSGQDSYRIVSIGEPMIIWEITNNRPTNSTEKKAKIYEKSGTEYFLEEPDLNSTILPPPYIETPLKDLGPRTFYNVSEGIIYTSDSRGILRNIYDFFSKSEIDDIINAATGDLVQADWSETVSSLASFIRNKPTTFSEFVGENGEREDIEYSLIQDEAPEFGYHSTYHLTKNGETLGTSINIPLDLRLKSGRVVLNENDDQYYLVLVVGLPDTATSDTEVWILVQGLVDVYEGSGTIDITENTISGKINPQNGFDINSFGRYSLSLADATHSGAMSPSQKQKLDDLDLSIFATTEELETGETEVKASSQTEGIIPQETDLINSVDPGFNYRTTAGTHSVSPGSAKINYIKGPLNSPFNPESLVSVGNNAVNPVSGVNIKYRSRLNYSKAVVSDNNYALVWFRCLACELSTSRAELKNNGYAITAGDTSLGVVGYSATQPRPNNFTSVDQILTPVSTVYNSEVIHYVPDSPGWIVVSVPTVNDTLPDNLLARLSWSGAYDRVYEPYFEDSVTLDKPGSNTWGALSLAYGEDIISDQWINENDSLVFYQYFGKIDLIRANWGSMKTESNPSTAFTLIYQGSEESIQILNSTAKLPSEMTVNGVSVTPSRTYTFGNTYRNEVTMTFTEDTVPPISSTEIRSKTFMGITSLISVVVPDSVNILDFDCFRDCTNLESVSLGTNVTYVGAGCFLNCENLRTIYSLNPAPPEIFHNTFPGSALQIVYVPGDNVDDYKAANYWTSLNIQSNPNPQRKYYQFTGLQGIIKESTNFLSGLPGVFCTPLGYLEFNTDGTALAPIGTLYYELKTPSHTSTGISAIYRMSDYGTERFEESGNLSCGEISIDYPINLMDDLRHSGEMLDQKLTSDSISSDLNSNQGVQNKVIKAYVDSVVREASYSSLKDLSRRDSFGNIMSERNTANCYIVRELGFYRIPLVYGNAIKNGVPNTPAYTGTETETTTPFVNSLGNAITSPYIEEDLGTEALFASVLWQDVQGMVTNVSISHGSPCRFVDFYVASIPVTGGNAVVCVMDKSQNILWSWHIWVFTDDITPTYVWNLIDPRPTPKETGGTKYNIMPFNLGTTWDDSSKVSFKSVSYQWGRKDPMIGPANYNSNNNGTVYGTAFSWSVANGTLSKGILNPTSFFTGNDWCGITNTYNLWSASCNTEQDGADVSTVKTIYDPCPYGWKVPCGAVFRGFTVTRNNTDDPGSERNTAGEFDYGWAFQREANDSTGVFFPALGYRDSSLSGVGSLGGYWTTAPGIYNDSACRIGLTFSSSKIYPLDYLNTTIGNNIRPVYEQ